MLFRSWVGLLDALPRRLRNLDSDEIPEERLPENRFSPSELREIEASILFLGRRIRKTVAEVSAAHQQLSQTRCSLAPPTSDTAVLLPPTQSEGSESGMTG